MRRSSLPMVPPLVAAAWAALLLLALPTRPAAHEVPASVTVRAFVRPEGDRLLLLVRVPLEAIRDIEFPLHGAGFLDIAAVDALLPGAAKQWIADYVTLYEDGARLPPPDIAATRISLPSDRSFATLDGALAHLRAARLPAGTDLPWQQAMLDVALSYPIASDRARFAIEPALAHLGVRTMTVLRFVPPDGAERVLQYVGDPGLVRLDPRWHQSFARFVALGFGHILDGIDHLLFVLCLVIPFRRLRPLVVIITSFTVAHSITLIASAAGFAPTALWFPPLVETLIALSIVLLAFENIAFAARPATTAHATTSASHARSTSRAGWRSVLRPVEGAGEPPAGQLRRRWLVAFAFGLVHGFGFSFVLRDSLQFAGSHLVTALLAFNVGVELGQLLVVVLAIPVLALLFSRVVAERVGTILLSALIAHTAWHWMTARGASLGEYDFAWPARDLALAAAVMRWLVLLLLLAGALWLLYGFAGRLTGPARRRGTAAEAER